MMNRNKLLSCLKESILGEFWNTWESFLGIWIGGMKGLWRGLNLLVDYKEDYIGIIK